MNMELFCKYCHKTCKNAISLSAHERLCPMNKDRVYVNHTKGHTPWNKGLTKITSDKVRNIAKRTSEALRGKPGHKHSEATKRLLSDIRKKQIAKNGGVWWNSRSKCKRSYAEEWIERLLKKETSDIKFYEEYHIGKWFLDFAWPDRKIGLEIDGAQHEWTERKQSDAEKDSYCQSLGWTILRLKWSDICNNTQQAIAVIKEFVVNSKIIDYQFSVKKPRILKGYYHLSEDEWNNRRVQILNSGIDLSKFGWKSKMIKHTGMTKRVIERTIEHFIDEFKHIVYKR